MKFPQKQVYFFYGNEEDKLNRARTELVDFFLPREEREENYSEFSPPSHMKRLQLSSVMPQLLAELGTISFFPDSRRVVVVYNLDELYLRKKKKTRGKSASGQKGKVPHEAYFIKYLEDQLPQTNNVLILVNLEDYEENRRVGEKSNLVKAIAKLGHLEKYYSRPLKWDLEDAIREKNFNKTMEVMRSWFQKDPESASRGLFYTILKQIVLMLQAKVILKKKSAFSLDNELSSILFPPDITYNFQDQHSFLQKKLKTAQKRYSTADLTRALQKLLEINTYLYPQTTDVFVPDFQIMMEQFLVEWMATKSHYK